MAKKRQRVRAVACVLTNGRSSAWKHGASDSQNNAPTMAKCVSNHVDLSLFQCTSGLNDARVNGKAKTAHLEGR